MIPRSYSTIRFTAGTLALLTLIGCASRDREQKSVVYYAPASDGRPAIVGALGQKQETVPQLASIDPDASGVPSPLGPLARMIDGMILGVDTDGYVLIQRRNARPIPVDQSLYQDAITLTTLRGRLHRVNGLDSRILDEARVRQGAAFLVLPDAIQPQAAADAINAALDTRGVAQVRARIPRALLAAR